MYILNEELLKGCELRVWELIKGRKGVRNAITSKEIESETGFNRFKTCRIVQRLRLNHEIPIVTNKFGANKGYFLPLNREEVKGTIEEMVKQAETLLAVVDILEKAVV